MPKQKSTNSDPVIKNLDGKAWSIPKDGSLGLLALGDIGLDMWRKARYGGLAYFPTALMPSNHKQEKDHE
ncbi:MAG: hypothetical protein AAF828_11540 [Bacteroidota bacterium]